jgi:hypothetical protein
MTVEWKCDDCGWVKLGDYCVCPQQATDSDCHCLGLTDLWDCKCGWRHKPGAECVCLKCERITSKCRCPSVRERCEDAPCCGCCDAGSAVMPG